MLFGGTTYVWDISSFLLVQAGRASVVVLA